MEVRVSQTLIGERVDVGSVDRRAVTAELREAEVVEEEKDDVRCRFPRMFAGRPMRDRLRDGSTDGALEPFVILHPLPILSGLESRN